MAVSLWRGAWVSKQAEYNTHVQCIESLAHSLLQSPIATAIISLLRRSADSTGFKNGGIYLEPTVGLLHTPCNNSDGNKK